MRSIFFFQAEDGIRDDLVTGVQTCALPIFIGQRLAVDGEDDVAGLEVNAALVGRAVLQHFGDLLSWTPICFVEQRSEERRVGKECRSWSSPISSKKTRHSLCASPHTTPQPN